MFPVDRIAQSRLRVLRDEHLIQSFLQVKLPWIASAQQSPVTMFLFVHLEETVPSGTEF